MARVVVRCATCTVQVVHKNTMLLLHTLRGAGHSAGVDADCSVLPHLLEQRHLCGLQAAPKLGLHTCTHQHAPADTRQSQATFSTEPT